MKQFGVNLCGERFVSNLLAFFVCVCSAMGETFNRLQFRNEAMHVRVCDSFYGNHLEILQHICRVVNKTY